MSQRLPTRALRVSLGERLGLAGTAADGPPVGSTVWDEDGTRWRVVSRCGSVGTLVDGRGRCHIRVLAERASPDERATRVSERMRSP